MKEASMEEEVERGDPREEPTAAEADFIERLEALMPRSLEFYFWQDRDGTPWMITFLSFSEMRGVDMGLVKTLRLDFDSRGVRGGWSTDNMDWDADIRAEAAGVDMNPPDGISIAASRSTSDEMARAVAAWFQRHWEEWLRHQERFNPAGKIIPGRMPQRRTS
jgi:hypothetical protein